jgi:multiple sugar transport system permease protein
MSSLQQVLVARTPGAAEPRGPRHRAELLWALAFVSPYAAVFLAFAAYPIAYALWLARSPLLYAALVADPLYLRTLVNTMLYVGLAVNLKMFLALLLSGFFMRRRWWVRALLVLYLLPWALPGIPAYLSFHWMLIGEQGFLDSAWRALTGIDGPIWFNDRWLALGADIVAYIWKWLPFWTVIFLAGRMAIPREILEAADIDGAAGARRFLHVTFPLLANLYLVSTLLSTLWTLGDFTNVFFVSGGAPAKATDVLATLSLRYAFEAADPALGIATVVSALPLLIPAVLLLMRRVQAAAVQL